ncbi:MULTISPECIES: polyamine ABC transporter substrate-binding protein [Hyphomicrobiales]|uniref:Putrescine-binding periplasmic protein n=1 Tax=Bauldia litoralis TaxID=665467 RepID=A0A1G6CQC1_9HYPH|nr:polyamine ABC transporter substrate-binding protein [Bauldia litoralis]SDB35091.1 putrescine transport system substrate-binding protein [Bauldia litoralis]
MFAPLSRYPLAAAVLAASIAGALAEDKVVNVYNWSDYVDEEVLAAFTAETGIEVVYDVYDNNEIVETKLLAGGSGYDVVVPSAPNVARLIQAGALQKLDKSKIPNLVHAWEAITARLSGYDPGNEYAVDYMWGTTGFGYNVAKIAERMPDAPVDSWAMIFDPEVVSKFADCGVYLLDTPEELIPAALNYLHLNPDSKETAEIEEAAKLLKTIRPYIEKFDSSEYINALANGDICLAVGYSGDVLQAADRAAEAGAGVEIQYVIPTEGAAMWFDSFIIPSDAPHPDAAHAFIDFMMRPESAAANSNYVYYANGNLESQSLLYEDVIGDPAIYPGQQTIDVLYTTTSHPPRVQRIVTRAWTNVKSGS